MNTNIIYELYRLKEENRQLKAALKPFAEGSSEITNADIERARQALNRE